jgi:hypothetical protein
MMIFKEPVDRCRFVDVIPGILDRTGQGDRAILLLLLPVLPVFFEWLNIKGYQLPNLQFQLPSKYF